MKNYLKVSLAWFVLLLGAGAAYGQTVSGTIVGDGEALESVTVIVEGTTIGTFSDENGKYSLTADGISSKNLIFKYVGYQDQIIAVNGRSTVDVTMSPNLSIDEVVVTGYGTAKSREVTSAISTVKAEDFNQGQVNDPTQLIQGKVAGLSIAAPGGDPNSQATIRLRGLSTLGANAEPLVVIDGVIGASLETVDPNDIQSVDILKDASAAAIYGSRASSGVLIITTKKGLAGSTRFDYNGFATFEGIANQVSVANKADYLRYREQTVRLQADPSDSEAVIRDRINNLDKGADTDWMDAVAQSSISQVHNLSMSGGTKGLTYRASVNFRDINGINPGTGFNQLNGRLNMQQKAFNDKLTVTFNVSATERRSNFGFNEAFRYATVFTPTAPVNVGASDPLFDTYGGYFQLENFDYFNPVGIQEQGQNTGTLKDLLLSIKGEYEIMDGLKASVSYSQNRESDIFGQYYSKQAYFRGTNKNGYAERFSEDRRNELFEIVGTYNTSFGDNDLEILAGYSHQELGMENFGIRVGDFISDETGFNNPFFGQNITDLVNQPGLTGTAEESKVIGFFGRARLNINETFYLTAAVRQEGSTRLGAENKWGTFPSVSAGLNITNLVDIGGVDDLKLRVGYGVTGALPPSPYLSIVRYTQANSFFFNGNYVPAYGPSQNANPNLKWEQKAEFDVGVDFAALDYKLTGTIDYYSRTTSDFIYQVIVPVPPNFADRTWANLEDVVLRNNGIELSVGYLVEGSNSSWEPRLVFSTFNTVLDTLDVVDPEFSFFSGTGFFEDPATSPGAPGLNNNPTMRVLPGQELGLFYGLDVDKDNPVNENGGYNYIDQNGDGAIDDADKTILGTGLPDFSIGFNNTFRFGDLDLSFFIRGDFGHDLINMYRVFYEPVNSRVLDNLVITDYFNENLTATPEFNGYYVEDGDFICLDNMSLGYTFDVSNSSNFDKVRLYVSGRNLLYFTNYQGVDPNIRYTDPGSTDNGNRADREFDPSALAPGIDRRNTYFRTRQFSVGVNLGF